MRGLCHEWNPMNQEATETRKWCSGCSASLVLAAFSPNRARPPLFVQSRCRSCTNAAKARKDAEKRRAAQSAKVSRELDAVAAEVSDLGTAGVVYAPRTGERGFSMRPLAVLEVPRTRGRWPAKPEQTDDLTGTYNWCDMLSDEARDRYRRAGALTQRQKAGTGTTTAWVSPELD